MRKVLIIDDEPQIRDLLKLALEASGFACLLAATGYEGIQTFRALHPDIVLLDLGLPDRDGAEVLRALREGSTAPIIIISVRDAEALIVELLNHGADDYLTKPFSLPLLEARMNAALRRQRRDPRESSLVVGDLAVNFGERQVSRNGADLHLTPTEYALVAHLARNLDRIVTLEGLMGELWGPEGDIASLRVHISAVRRKIEADPARPTRLVTETGIGYRLCSGHSGPAGT